MSSKILLIEDDQMIRELFASEITRAGYEVLAVCTAEDGLKSLSESPFDLVLLDIMLPGINGLDALKKIKENPQTKNTKVVLLTNLGSEVIIADGFQFGATGYMVKSSFTPDQLVQEVKNYIES